MAGCLHQFHASAFAENFSLKELARALPEGRLRTRELHFKVPDEGDVFLYPFGAVVFQNVSPAEREQWLARIQAATPGLTRKVVVESFTVQEEAGAKTELVNGVLRIDDFGPPRIATVALIVAQSAAMEYYERLVDDLFARTASLVAPLERRGTVPVRTSVLHRFIGEAITSRNEVLSILHLLDKPDEIWEDPKLDLIYNDLRSEFDLVDRYQALESKLRGVQEALELVLDVARERRMWLLEALIAVLILVELVLSLWRR